MRAQTILWFSSDRERPIFFLSWANQETTMPGKQAAEKGAGSDAASTPSNYLTIRGRPQHRVVQRRDCLVVTLDNDLGLAIGRLLNCLITKWQLARSVFSWVMRGSIDHRPELEFST